MLLMPEQLRAELRRMRRNPDEFTVIGKTSCKFCGGARTALALSHPAVKNAGTYCPGSNQSMGHGWIHFASPQLPQTFSERPKTSTRHEKRGKVRQAAAA